LIYKYLKNNEMPCGGVDTVIMCQVG